MRYFLIAVALLLCTVNAPQPVGAIATLSISFSLSPGETYANAWAAAGPTPPIVDSPCGTNGAGVRNTQGSMVECPTGASHGTSRTATAPNNDTASARAWAQISAGVGTASAPVTISSKPQVFAGAAAYAKANSAVPVTARGAGKVGGNFTITYGSLTLNGWSEPVDNLTLIEVDDLGPHQIPDVLANVLDEDSIELLKKEGITFAKPTKVYFRIPMVLRGNKDAKVTVGKPTYLQKDLPMCPQNYKEMLQACLISEQPPSQTDFKTPCMAGGCRADELSYSLPDIYTVQLYVPGNDLSEYLSVHEIRCVKSRRPDDSPPEDGDICSLNLRIPQAQE